MKVHGLSLRTLLAVGAGTVVGIAIGRLLTERATPAVGKMPVLVGSPHWPTVPADGSAPTYTPDDVIHVADGSFSFPSDTAAVAKLVLLQLDARAVGTLVCTVVVRVYPSPDNLAFRSSSLCGSWRRVADVVGGTIQSTTSEYSDDCPSDTVALHDVIEITSLGLVQHGRQVNFEIEAKGGLFFANSPADLQNVQDWDEHAHEPFVMEIEARWQWIDA